MAVDEATALRLQAQRRQGLLLILSVAIGFGIVKYREFQGEKIVSLARAPWPAQRQCTDPAQAEEELTQKCGPQSQSVAPPDVDLDQLLDAVLPAIAIAVSGIPSQLACLRNDCGRRRRQSKRIGLRMAVRVARHAACRCMRLLSHLLENLINCMHRRCSCPSS
eukprot:scaffold229962_cov33-Tisochrysis_lutea.AAC.1